MASVELHTGQGTKGQGKSVCETPNINACEGNRKAVIPRVGGVGWEVWEG